jgi:hypothetical protein
MISHWPYAVLWLRGDKLVKTKEKNEKSLLAGNQKEE